MSRQVGEKDIDSNFKQTNKQTDKNHSYLHDVYVQDLPNPTDLHKIKIEKKNNNKTAKDKTFHRVLTQDDVL